jgi:iron complex transport system substrate-binding protein
MNLGVPALRYLVAVLCCLGCNFAKGADVAALRIVSLAPSLTELAFTAGAGDRLVGVDQYSDFPEAARAIPRIGDAFRVDFERVLALRPDVVLAWDTGTSAGVIDRLRGLNVTVKLLSTQRIADVGKAVREIGRLAGTSATADAAARDFERQVAALRAEYAGRDVLRVFLQVNDKPLYTVNGQQIMSEVVELCGGRNVFAQLDKFAPEIGIEAVIAANPEVIISTEYKGTNAMEQWQRWPNIPAVKNGNVYNLPPDDVTRATTRLARGAGALCRTLETARRKTPKIAPVACRTCDRKAGARQPTKVTSFVGGYEAASEKGPQAAFSHRPRSGQ